MVITYGLFWFGIGLVFGSFVNALIWRIHKQRQLKATDEQILEVTSRKKSKNYSISRGRSMCSRCEHPLSPRDLVPIISWVLLRGKCRYCHQTIEDKPWVELLTGIAFLFFYLGWPFALSGGYIFAFFAGLTIIVLFVALSAYDARWYLLPDRLVSILTIMSVLYTALIWIAAGGQNLELLTQPFLAGVLFFGFFWVLYQISKGEWIGGGDVKLAFALGVLAGSPLRALLVVFMASLVGSFLGLPHIIRREKNARLPFGPSLMLATFVILLWGTQIVRWYQGLLY